MPPIDTRLILPPYDPEWPRDIYVRHMNVVKHYYFPPYNTVENPTFGWLMEQIIPREQLKKLKLYMICPRRLSYRRDFDFPIKKMLEEGYIRLSGSYVEIGLSLIGGKGGFGSMLRAQGGKMNKKVKSNNDACRDLTGRRLKSIRKAKKLAEHLEGQEEREKEKKERIKKKIEKGLNRKMPAKALFEDHEYLKQNEELKSGVKAAVSKALNVSNIQDQDKKTNKRTVSVFMEDNITDSEEDSELESEDPDVSSEQDDISSSNEETEEEEEEEEEEASESSSMDEEEEKE